jgi:hypothetical protein
MSWGNYWQLKIFYDAIDQQGPLAICKLCGEKIFKTMAIEHLEDHCNPDIEKSEDDDILELEPKANEIEEIDSLLGQIKDQKLMRRGDKLAIISSKWMTLWRDSKKEPVDNSDLFDFDGNLKPGLCPGIDYEVLPGYIWKYLTKQYGGGPELLRSPTAIGLFFQIDLYPLSVNVCFKGSSGKHRISRLQTVKGIIYEIGALVALPPASLCISLVNDKDESIPFMTNIYTKTLQELGIEDGDKFIVEVSFRQGKIGYSAA